MTLEMATVEEERPDPSYFLHNLRNYIGTVIQNADRLKADRNEERALQLIAKAGTLALRDLQAFTDLTRPLDLKIERLELGAWLRQTVEKHQASKALKITWAGGDAPVSTHADPAFLAEAADAILLNSVEAMPEGGEISVGATTGPGGWSCLWFEDRSGPKLREVTLEMIGAPFFTLKPNRLGLGLSRARHILLQHGGKTEISGSPAGGLRVQFMLPPSTPV
jgi:two-component system, NtrC family, sensor histidine kinase HydH